MRPLHLRPRFVAVVFVGGTFGTAAREAISLMAPAANGPSYSILAINVVGALLLGWLLDALVRSGADTGRRRLLRLGMGTGFLGGFTTYSSLAVNTAQHLGGVGLGYGVGTVVLGAVATAVGIWLGSRRHPRTPSPVGGEKP